ncbi:MAG TPA: M23 family metallopeptidase [Puia sp.]
MVHIHPPVARRIGSLLLLLLLVASLADLYIRSSFSTSYFRKPLDISLQLAANFGELREDHFHMGLDIRTMGREDLPVYAAADGYISHVKIEPYGLGKALFITHPNGRTTVYGHLDRFFPELSAMIQQRQYAAERWEQELDLPPGRFPVRKGQFIAYSGNTGSSQAPHLHFEIRDTRTGRNINPLLSGFTIPDELPPVIKGLYWYDRRISTYSTRARKIALTSQEGIYRTTEPVIKLNSPLVSLGISATDKASNSPHLSGIFHAELWLDDSLIHAFSLTDLSYADTRYINACIDYTKWIRSGIYVQHLSILPGNHLSIFTSPGKDGLIRLKDTLVHLVHIRVSDVNNNYSDLDLKIQLASPSPLSGSSVSAVSVPDAPLPHSARLLLPGRENRVNGPSVRARFSATAFYDQVPFLLYEEANTGSNKASALIHLHDPTVPVHDRFSVQLRTTLAPGDPLRNRTVMQLVSGDSQSIVKGDWQGDWMSGSFSRLGDLQLLIDTMAPQIEAFGWTEGQRFPADAPALNLICKDEGGMIARFRAELDGHWILFEQKGVRFRYDFDGHCPTGPHRLWVSVTDVAGNETRKAFSFSKQ